MPYIGTCFRFYKQMRVQKKPKLLPIKLKTVYTTVYINYNICQTERKLVLKIVLKIVQKTAHKIFLRIAQTTAQKINSNRFSTDRSFGHKFTKFSIKGARSC